MFVIIVTSKTDPSHKYVINNGRIYTKGEWDDIEREIHYLMFYDYKFEVAEVNSFFSFENKN